ncbi:Nucleoside triphosphate pyrophosphatase Maf-like protein [Dioscorea alata]|uniref:Nucleoside triphosphate pyrophosphatase Maf-like protein n=1 Tax=Dioscorea alata TaxID=55571 RepID=A0ACB7WNB0_DIOAL|nr:Nucleoside triphosphate pyrophosphatase Maf-like protein [Dioscorea alata]
MGEMVGSQSQSSFKIILGSSSIARKKILAEMGYKFETADIDEKSIRRESPEELVTVLAEAKVAVYEGTIREKPTSEEEARQFLRSYSQGHVSTVGSVLVTNLKTGIKHGGIDKAEVYFHDIPDEIIQNLIDERVVFNVAGGLLLEHPLILPFVDTLIGASDSVMGLPKALTEKLIQEALSYNAD